MDAGSKARVTLTIDKEVYEKAKEVAESKKISISGQVEKFLEFLTEPHVYCFRCGEKFYSEESELCPICGWMRCPRCEVCRCDLDDEEAKVVFHMRRVYEDLLPGRIKE
jgi:hypothetical protein